MQTFLPISDFRLSAEALDYRRLGKQRVEVLQILNTLYEGSRWENHPAVRMWRGYEPILILYGVTICEVWKERGYKDTCYGKIRAHYSNFDYSDPFETPFWYGDERFHLSHKSNLIRKFPEHYGPMWPEVPNDLPYYWPV